RQTGRVARAAGRAGPYGLVARPGGRIVMRRRRGRRTGTGSPRGRVRVGVIFGGRSVEHEVSLVSARAIMQALDPDRYEVVPIGITRQGRWELGDTHCVLPPDPSVQGLVRLHNGAGGGRITRAPAGKRPAENPGKLDVIF